MNAMENIMMPMHLTSEKNKKERALELLDLVGMSHRKFSRMNQLSGGEQQRIAIAIALANKPKLLLADEPTGSVDRKTADYIFDLFKRLNKEYNQTIIIVTHDVELSKKVARVVAIRDGKISSECSLLQRYQRPRHINRRPVLRRVCSGSFGFQDSPGGYTARGTSHKGHQRFHQPGC